MPIKAVQVENKSSVILSVSVNQSARTTTQYGQQTTVTSLKTSSLLRCSRARTLQRDNKMSAISSIA